MNEKHAMKSAVKKAAADAAFQAALADLERQVDEIKWAVARQAISNRLCSSVDAEQSMIKRLDIVLDAWIGSNAKRWGMRNALFQRYASHMRASHVAYAYAVINKDANASPW